MLVIVWEYMARPDRLAEFESLYRPDGPWVELFKKSPGFVSTTLMRDVHDTHRFVIADRWMSEASYEAFKLEFAPEYESLTARGVRPGVRVAHPARRASAAGRAPDRPLRFRGVSEETMAPANPTTYDVKLPDIGEGVAEGEIVRWLVKVGDAVREDQPLVEVMTDKASVEIPSPRTGTIAALHAEEGGQVPGGKIGRASC